MMAQYVENLYLVGNQLKILRDSFTAFVIKIRAPSGWDSRNKYLL